MKKKQRPQGFFITVEGGEGSGKSTLLSHLEDYLQKKGYDCLTTREPGGTRLGGEIRKLLLDQQISAKIGHKAELLLFLADRAQHIEEVIEPAVKSGKIVLCDRFNDSTIAYQGTARGLNSHDVQKLCQMVCGALVPHLTLLLDVDPVVGLSRAKKIDKEHSSTGELDRIESENLQFHQNVRREFQKIARQEPLRVVQIDATQSPETILEKSLQAINQLLLLPAHKGFA